MIGHWCIILDKGLVGSGVPWRVFRYDRPEEAYVASEVAVTVPCTTSSMKLGGKRRHFIAVFGDLEIVDTIAIITEVPKDA